jgi:5-dehydro-4-deoxyglucarate dehydratase
MILPSAYSPADQDGLVAYYGGIARSVAIGVVPYARDAARLEVDTVCRLAELPNVIAYKDAIADFRLWNRLRASLGDRLVWIAGAGDDLAAPYFALGATAFTSSHANYDPAVAMFLRDLLQQGRFAEARGLLDAAIQPFFTIRARRRGYEVSVTKAAMDMRGRPGGPVRPPFVAVSDAERGLIGEALERSAAYLDGLRMGTAAGSPRRARPSS